MIQSDWKQKHDGFFNGCHLEGKSYRQTVGSFLYGWVLRAHKLISWGAQFWNYYIKGRGDSTAHQHRAHNQQSHPSPSSSFLDGESLVNLLILSPEEECSPQGFSACHSLHHQFSFALALVEFFTPSKCTSSHLHDLPSSTLEKYHLKGTYFQHYTGQ